SALSPPDSSTQGVGNYITATPDQSGKSLKAIYQELDKDILDTLGKVPLGQGGPVTLRKFSGNIKKTAVFSIQYNLDDPLERAMLTIARRPGPDFSIWSVRLEFNPRKAGSVGLVQIQEGVELAAPFVDFDKALGAFTISRLDAAIDCIGVTPLDLIALIPKPGKRMVYLGKHGMPETIYFYQDKLLPKNPPKTSAYRTTGTHRLTLYERRAYQKQLAQPSTYGDCPVTRAEVVQVWRSKRPAFADLVTMQNLFEGRRVAYAAAVPIKPTKRKLWKQFCLAAVGAGVDKATWTWMLSGGSDLAKKYSECQGDLVSENAWISWPTGLAYTGLEKWIAQANKAAAVLYPSLPTT
ncbi:hypothetical protein, partial [Polymorphobacter multimanifer]